jgi:hypothetical protein
MGKAARPDVDVCFVARGYFSLFIPARKNTRNEIVYGNFPYGLH